MLLCLILHLVVAKIWLTQYKTSTNNIMVKSFTFNLAEHMMLVNCLLCYCGNSVTACILQNGDIKFYQNHDMMSVDFVESCSHTSAV